MVFKPKTQEIINQERLWLKGEYDFEVVEAVEDSSHAGNQMIRLKLRLTKPDGLTRLITDYLVDKRLEKLLHASTACGLAEKYKAGKVLAEDFIGKRGKLTLGIEKDKKQKYPDKNVVLDYVCAESLKNGSAASSGAFGLKF